MTFTRKATRIILGSALVAYATWVLLIAASFTGTAIGNAIR